ncbi:LysR family transcriptional regulator, partial [Escherichia coli]|nr:LysR family transcriptional regulator [Escherichia coli]
MKLDERHLVQLAAVVQAGGVTEGAALIGMTQPALSRTLAVLEQRIGEALFVRGKRPLQPTPLGKALAEHGQAMLSASRKAAALVDGFHKGSSGLVRVGGTPFFMDALISGMTAEFQNVRPDIKVEQSYGYLATLREALDADRIDLAICPVDILDEGSGLKFQIVLPGRNVVACRATHPLLRSRKIDARRLLDFPWIAPPPGSPLLADLHSLALSLGATEIKVRYSGGSLTSAVNYMKASDALTILPHSVVFAYRNERSITALPVEIAHPDRALGILRRTETPHA